MISTLLITLGVVFSPKVSYAETFRHSDKFFQQKKSPSSLKIISLNVHNLYDSKHDRGYFDYTFLPKSHHNKKEKCQTVSSQYYRSLCLNLNWTSKKVDQKIEQILSGLKTTGSLPDILAVQEIENEKVLQRFARKAGYKKFLITKQKSRRGIDVGLLWNSKKLKYIDHSEVAAPLRDPLRVELQVRSSGESLFIYVNHWAAQTAPTHWRAESAAQLREDIDDLLDHQPQANIVVLGDFNVTRSEEREVFSILTDRHWQGQLFDTHKLSRRRYPSYAKKFPDGTYYSHFQQAWDRLDRIFINKNLLRGKTHADIRSYRVVFTKFLVSTEKVKDPQTGTEQKIQFPSPYNFLERRGSPLGVSDHLPVSIILQTP